MSIRLLSAAWDLDIGSTEKMVLMCLCDHANDDGICWPSVARIVRKTSKSERTVQSALKWLRDNEYFRIDGYHGATPKYVLDPRKICTPAEIAPPQKLRRTPAKSAPKPSGTPIPPVSANADTPPAANDDVLKPEHVVEAWNETASRVGLSKVVRLTDARRKRLRTMIAQHPPDDFAAALDALERSPFCRGERSDWKADFDFFLQTKSFTKLLEGAYG
ncbi:helix-turn-helix domain-containing protein [Sphingopyxis sp. Geo48]|uniref:helix-turn-helix domain-containing protein n=1 Tax=Sphingopyxis sp. Geo48 TaxID=545241 RepID=UPI0024B86C39|nr:helix-turn-helix domain-containing protein [Sphingopyxis sp. Geo48]